MGLGMGARMSIVSTTSSAPKKVAGRIALASESKAENVGFDEVEGEVRIGSRVACAGVNGMNESVPTSGSNFVSG